MRRAVCSWLVLLAACPAATTFPGNEVMGTFSLRAVPLIRQCALDDMSGAPLEFDATFSKEAGTTQAWVTLQGTARLGSWDGQYFSSSASARRLFATQCAECETYLDEDLTVALLSRTQSDLTHNQCPDDALDGGVPPPDFDGGVMPPAMTRLGFDAVRACGELFGSVRGTRLVDGGACAPECSACQVRYRLQGERK